MLSFIKKHGNVGDGKDKGWVVRWLRRRGLPFKPRQRWAGVWRFGCSWLTKEGRCLHYRKRPMICKKYALGEDAMCALYGRRQD